MSGTRLVCALLAWATLALSAVPVSAQPATAPAPAIESALPTSAEARRAEQIEALIAGKLAADVDARRLFAAGLRTTDIAVTRAVLALTGDAALYARASRDPAVLDPLTADQAALALAEARFLRLPPARRDALLAQHEAKVAKQRQAEDNVQARKTREAELTRQIADLEAFLAGKPSKSGSLSLNLLSDLAGLAAQPGDTDAAPAPGEGATQEQLQQRLAQLRRQVLELPNERLAALQRASGINLAPDAALAAAEAQQRKAEIDASMAESERDRLVAVERSKLLAVNAAQARFAGVLKNLAGRSEEIANSALGWRLRVMEIEALPRNSGEQADDLYRQLVDALQATRRELRATLGASQANSAAKITPPPLDEALTSGIGKEPELIRLRDQLVQKSAALLAEEKALKEREQRALRDAMVLVNQARLDLIPQLSSAKKSAVLGFGSEGIAQVSRELSQITLDTRFQAVNWTNSVETLLKPFRRPTPSFAFSLLGIIALILLFRLWRRRGAAMLQSSEDALRRKRPRSFLNEAQANALSYIRRIRRPLDWFVFVILLRWLLPTELQLGGLTFFWTITTFSLAALLGARLADELARGRRRDDPRAQLRWISLRLVIGVLFAVVLVLELTQESVGKGAIYNWVASFSWLLSLPIVMLLAHWWRERIVSLSKAGSGQSPFLAWVARDPGGISGLIGRSIAGTVLLFQGAGSIIARRARDFGVVRELIEQRSRALAARQVAEDKASGIYHRPTPEVLATLDPHRPPEKVRSGFGPDGNLELGNIRPGSIIAITGDRGLGKSATLRDLAAGREAAGEDCFTVRIGNQGFAGILEDIGRLAGRKQGKPSEDQLTATLAGRKVPTTIIIDDLQRLVVPAIGGLTDLDRLIALARRTGDSCAWVMAMGSPAWNYISRARFDRVLFDKMIRLPRWSPEEIQALIARRTEQAGLKPDFNDLLDAGSFQLDGELGPEERKRLGYFERLTEYANGNPAIALEFWRRSLFIDSTNGKIVVRTFATPPVAELSALPGAAMFVLRAILQMDVTDQSAIERSTDLSPVIVADAIRGLTRLGVIAERDVGLRINLFWWSEVVRILERQNLIVRA